MSVCDQPELPEGEYAIVEVLGHRTIVGRVEEVERFGAKMMVIQPLFSGKLLDAVMVGGASIYQFTPCSAETALKRAPTELYQLPASIRAVLPLDLLPTPAAPTVMNGHGEEIGLPCPFCSSESGGGCDECTPF